LARLEEECFRLASELIELHREVSVILAKFEEAAEG